MSKSELGSLSGNIFFPCISKNESIYYKTGDGSQYGRPKTKLKGRISRSHIKPKRGRILYKRYSYNYPSINLFFLEFFFRSEESLNSFTIVKC